MKSLAMKNANPEQAGQPVYVYRGVHAQHPALSAARQGIVIPGDRDGTVTPDEHNRGGVSATSPFTSWTYDYEVAYGYAADREGRAGVILRLTMEAPDRGSSWAWIDSPNQHEWEQEVLLQGVRMDAEVIFGERLDAPASATGRAAE